MIASVMFADFLNDDERDRKESNEGCQDAAEARASARARRVRTRSGSDGITRRPGPIILRSLLGSARYRSRF